MTRSLHRALRQASLASLVALALVSPAFSNNTWIVDINNGPNTNFTNIPPAIAASVDGDVIIVRAGTYSSFTLDRGVSILGQGNAVTSGYIYVSGVPAGSIAALYNVEPQASWYSTLISNCAGTVLIQRCDSPFSVQYCSDVRFRDVTSGSPSFSSQHGLFVRDSRVEVVRSTLRGNDSIAGWCEYAEDGGDGIQCVGTSQLLLSYSTAIG